ncbi:MAG: rod-binding protein [Rhodospirillaceae bacterium]|nr:rod-binding protein [Rhodospirillaceae bacterium]
MTGDVSSARQAAEDFEAVFLSQMLQHMFAGIETDPMFGGGQAEEIYRSMMIEQFGDEMAKAGGIGLADAVTRELLTLQEA